MSWTTHGERIAASRKIYFFIEQFTPTGTDEAVAPIETIDRNRGNRRFVAVVGGVTAEDKTTAQV